MSQESSSADAAEASEPAVRLGKFVLDTPDPRGLAQFYAELLGWSIDEDSSDDSWVNVSDGGRIGLAFQRATDLIKPTWPDHSIPQQAHLDLYVPTYDEAEAKALRLGATLLEGSERHDDFRVYADPSGHPFCLCLGS